MPNAPDWYSKGSAWETKVPASGVDNQDLAFHLREAARTVENQAKEITSLWQQLEEERLAHARLKEDYEDHFDRCAGEREEFDSPGIG